MRLARVFPATANRRAARILVLGGSLLVPDADAVQSVTLSLGSIEAGGLRIENAVVQLADINGGAATLTLGRLVLAGRDWRNVLLRCPLLQFRADGVDCRDGTLALPIAGLKPQPLPINFSWRSGSRGGFDATIQPAPGESWRITTAGRGVRLTLDHADLARATAVSPDLAKWQVAGRISGDALVEKRARELHVSGSLALDGARFADAGGNHAGESIVTRLDFSADGGDGRWNWQANLDWSRGEVYSAPFYLASPGVMVKASGRVDGARLNIDQATIESAALGRIAGSAAVDVETRHVVSASFASETLDLAKMAPAFVTPMIASLAGPKLKWSGTARIAGELRDNVLASAQVVLNDVSLREADGRYALEKVSATIPWRADASTDAQIDIARANWGRLPIGPLSLPLKLRGTAVRLNHARIPLLDGAIELDDVRYTRGSERTSWRAAIAVTPVSMERLSAALGWPRMDGLFSASIPGIRQEGSTIALEGAVVVQVFDGFASVTDLSLIEPFGALPRLYADVELRNLDLDMLTKTFSFGSITGRIDGDLKGLELAGTRPLRFDARIESSPGNYRKRISQRAVQNISALGGAGAAAAVQRSVLRVFEEFSYGKLGMTCKLRDSVCEMGGVDTAPSGYVMVKGAGLPAINVIGYNRRVDWNELLARLKRVTEGNMKPVVR